MKERPILYSAPMVRAILDGRKTQTRRLVKINGRTPKGTFWDHSGYVPCRYHGEWHGGDLIKKPPTEDEWWSFMTEDNNGAGTAPGAPIFKCPYGNRGDRLWGKECFYVDQLPWASGGALPKERPEWADTDLYYRADGECCQQIPECSCAEVGKTKWRPSIHMPRWASRITQELQYVRVERLNDISEKCAEAEGVDFMRHIPDADETLTAKQLYMILWESIHGEGSWAKNPWVWVLAFKRVQ